MLPLRTWWASADVSLFILFVPCGFNVSHARKKEYLLARDAFLRLYCLRVAAFYSTAMRYMVGKLFCAWLGLSDPMTSLFPERTYAYL